MTKEQRLTELTSNLSRVHKIKEYVETSGITFSHIAKKTKFSNTYVSLLLHGKKPMHNKQYNKICEALGREFDSD